VNLANINKSAPIFLPFRHARPPLSACRRPSFPRILIISGIFDLKPLKKAVGNENNQKPALIK